MNFTDFLGNQTTVRRLRETLAAGRLPSAMIFSGSRGAGKYTLALLLAQAANCLTPITTDGLRTLWKRRPPAAPFKPSSFILATSLFVSRRVHPSHHLAAICP